jgi:hypothetical protein
VSTGVSVPATSYYILLGSCVCSVLGSCNLRCVRSMHRLIHSDNGWVKKPSRDGVAAYVIDVRFSSTPVVGRAPCSHPLRALSTLKCRRERATYPDACTSAEVRDRVTR